MHAMTLPAYGSPDVLRWAEVPLPVPKADEVRIRIEVASVNDWDWAILLGDALLTRLLHGLTRPKVPILGCDAAGWVDAVGAEVTAFQPGDRVMVDLSPYGFGAFADYACAPARALTRLPEGLAFEAAAALPQAGLLAVQGLGGVDAVQPGQRVLLNGAGGGVGTIALQLAKRRGAHVTVVDLGEKLPLLQRLGADAGLDYTREDFTRTGERYDLILDVKTNRGPGAYLRALAPGGTYATVGGDTARLLQVALAGLASPRTHGKRLRLVALRANQGLADLAALAAAGEVAPVLDETHALADLPAAFRRFGTGRHQGKILVRIEAGSVGP